jgi:hypothetical protein
VADPVLLLHRADPTLHVYATTGVQSPASIRDQMIRGKWIVERAADADAGILSPTSPLLVVGAGAGGVTAAMTARDLNVPVTLVDVEAQAFSRQRQCTTRYVEPSLYDWPLPRHVNVNLAAGMPLAYSADFAADVVARYWDTRFSQSRSAGAAGIPGVVRAAFRHTVADVQAAPAPAPPGTLAATLRHVASGATSILFCAMVLYTTGAGEERVQVGTYTGFRFWDKDVYDRQPLVPRGQASAIVSGGGDGALQDFLRLATEPRWVRSPRQLWDAIINHVPQQILLAIQQAESQAERVLLWSGGKAHDCEALTELGNAYNEVLRDLRSRGAMPAITQLLRPLLRTPFPARLDLLHPCSHFSRSYSLNHFLVLLLLDLFGGELGMRRRPGSALADVVSMGARPHICRDAGICHGEDHHVSVVDQTCVVSRTGAPVQDGPFNVVVVRHGSSAKPMMSAQGPVPIPRQILPYELR